MNIGVTPVTDGFTDADETLTVAEDSGVTNGSLLTGTTSVDGPLSIQSFSVAGQTGPFTTGTAYVIAGQGTLTVNANGTYSFEPAANWNGNFPVVTYTVTDGVSTDTSTLNIGVTPVTDGFTDADETLTVAEDSGVTNGSLLTGTTSVDGPLSIQSFSVAGQTGPFTLGTAYVIAGQGTLTVNANGTYSFEPAANWNGNFPVVTYTVTDGVSTDTSTLNIGVTPVTDGFTDADETLTVAEDSGVTNGSLLTGTTSVDGPLSIQSFSVAGQTGPFTLGTAYVIAGQGTLTVNASGTYSFEPAANWNGNFPGCHLHRHRRRQHGHFDLEHRCDPCHRWLHRCR
ncbi:cadherin-like domain-containing protein [Shewanella sp. DC2-4]|uniref:cadherin-like domain-containing protein n=1 Tax=Shewanella sp. DC2-4 TaxID=2739431 RepID=UPI001566FE53|nr:Ig-like domain-containing protein [Shewanella sp. DC2-4]NRD34039.1 cadherin-like domain-containing protein [Shewanella sp. DC2-4]